MQIKLHFATLVIPSFFLLASFALWTKAVCAEDIMGIRMPINSDVSVSTIKQKYRLQPFASVSKTHSRYFCGDDYAEIEGGVLWAPIDEVVNGFADFESVKSDAKTGRLFSCGESSCNIIVEASETNTTKAERQFALCNVMRINDRIGVPEECYVVALQRGKERWVRVDTKDSKSCPTSGIFYYPIGDIDLDYTIIAKWDTSVLLSALTNVLQSSPLNLQVQTSSWGDVMGVIGVDSYRVSPYLSPYREIVEISALVQEDTNDIKKRLVKITIKLLISRQNSGDKCTYHAPNEAQRQSYLKGVMAIFHKVFEQRCKRANWSDDFSFECNDAVVGNSG